MSEDETPILPPSHHIKLEYCETRPKYRRCKKKRSVRVFTVNSESKYLIVTDVPITCLESDLIKLFASFGTLKQTRELPDYPQEEFIKTFLIEFQDIQRAKTAKKFTDEKNFYGGMLHVCYAPEYETVSDTREKINHRRSTVTTRVKILEKEARMTKSKQPSANKSNEKIEEKCKSYKKNAETSHDKLQADEEMNNIGPQLPGSSSTISNQGFHPQIPCNQFGIPLFLPPPPPPEFVPYRNRSVSKANSHNATESNVPKRITNKNPPGSVKKTLNKENPKMKVRSGYFYQSVAQSTKQTVPRTDTNNIAANIKSNPLVSFKPPPFIPRHLKKTATNENTNSKNQVS